MQRSKGRPNSNCCLQTQELQCACKFNPPLLSTPTEFCTEVLAKGLPVPCCVLAQPKKLVVEKEIPPLAKLATSRHIKNWQRWCHIWRQTYNALTAKRNVECRPPVMSSGESYQFKKEDKELFDRTVHAYRLNGFYIRNADDPDSMRPKPCGDDIDIKEVMTGRYLRDFPEMKRHRYPTHVRNEVSIPPRKNVPKKGAKTSTHDDAKTHSGPKGFNFEEQWTKTKHVQNMKERLSCDFEFYGKINPMGDNLIFEAAELIQPESVHRKRSHGTAPVKTKFSVPELVFTVEDEKDAELRSSFDITTNHDKVNTVHYLEFHGPILRIRSQFSDTALKYSKPSSESPQLISESLEPSTLEGQYFFDGNEHFSVTSKCKDMKYIELTNEGTTAIRYQWFRNPPNKDEVKMLQDSTYYKSLRLPLDGDKLQKENASDMKSITGKLTLSKKATLEFHFSELPGIILPGQSMEFPIIFRSKTPGYFQETIYLLTHPKLTRDGMHYAVHLSGVCTHVGLEEKGNELYEVNALGRYLDGKSLEAESEDLTDSIVERALWEAVHWQAGGHVGGKRELLTDSKVKLFEEVMCDQIEKILSSIDNYKMLDYQLFDIFNVIENSC